MMNTMHKRHLNNNIMPKNFVITLLTIFVFSCSNTDKSAQLEALKRKREKITAKIELLEKEIASEGIVQEAEEEKLTPVRIASISTGIFNHYIEVQGEIESDKNIFVPAQSPGIVKKIHVKKGDRVTKGQLLAALDGSVYERSIDEIITGLELTTTVYERQKRLWEKGIGSEIQYLQAKTNKESLEKRLQTVKEQYKLTKIISPIDGTVDEVAIKEGEAAGAGFGAIRVVQLTNLKVKAFLSESYISQVKKRDMVKIFIPSLNKEFKQSIDAVSQVIDPDNRTFDIEIRIPGPEKGIKPNMLAVLTINDYSNPKAFTVPLNVVQRLGEEQFLFVAEKENNQWVAKKRIVKGGMYYQDKLEILEGLQEGENIITFGFQNIADGQLISVHK